MSILSLKIADFYFKINECFGYSDEGRFKFLEDKCSYSFECVESDISYEKKLVNENIDVSEIGKTIILRKISNWLPHHNAFLLHSACFDVGGVGVAFAAHSGTGKSTHMLNWQKVLGDNMTVVNGDKPIVRFFSQNEEKPDGVLPDIPYAYGTPWNGKERLGCNMRTHLQHICFIERSKTNFVTKIDKNDAVNRIMNQVYMPKDPVALMNTLSLIDKLMSSCELWIIHCNMDVESAEVAYKTIFANC